MKKAIREGTFGRMFGSVAEIRPELNRVEDRMTRLREQTANFEVLEEYRAFAREAADARRRIKAIGHELVQARQTIEHLRRVSEVERRNTRRWTGSTRRRASSCPGSSYGASTT